MSGKNKESKSVRDLIRIGIFSALWIAAGWLIACTIGFFPPVLIVLPCIIALVGALILTALLSRVNLRGGIFIPSFLFGLCLFTMVPYGMLFICTAVCGLIGEIICDTAGKRSGAAKIVSITFPMVGIALGEYIPLCFMQEAFKALYADSFTGPVGMAAIEILNVPFAAALTAATAVCAVLGCLWGRRIAEKRLAAQGGKANGKSSR